MSTSPFDDKAATWDDDPDKVARAGTVAAAVRAAAPLDPGTRLLEYGAGTGLVTQALRDDVGPVTLADSSRGMLDVLHAKVAAGTLRDARVWELDLSRDAAPAGERFDLVLTVMTLHHIGDLPPVLRGLAALVEPGGHLCVADLEREDGSFHDDDFDGHHGFDRRALRADLEAAGFADVRFADCGEVVRHGRAYGLFLATGTRPGAPAR